MLLLLVGLAFRAMAASGGLDAAFNPGTGADGNVQAVVVQPDGKLLLGGAFGFFNGVAQSRVTRLNADGSVDSSFTSPTGIDGTVYALARQVDGKVIVGGNFYGVNGSNNRGIARLNADGSRDATANWVSNGVRTDGTVNAICVQPDGKILIGGTFSQVNGLARNRLARLNSDGTLDMGFVVGGGPGGAVAALVMQADGRILVGGQFSTYNGVAHNPVARLNADGSLDTSFDSGPAINGYVACINVLANGSILLGGGISAGNNSRMVQLTASGALDTSFSVGNTINSELLVAAVQGDGKILIGGYFSSINGVSRPGIARLQANGSLDTSFDPGLGLNDLPYALVLDNSGQVVVGGKFTRAGGQVRNHIVRLDNLSAPVITSQPQSLLVAAGTNITFSVTAAGAQPLAYQWYFNGALRAGANLATLSLTDVQAADVGNYTVVVTNAQGSTTSSVAVLTLGTAPVVTLQPLSVMGNVGDTVSFVVAGTGSPAVNFQWQFNGTNLAGAAGTTLTLANVQPAQAGNYTVVLSNALGTAVSTVATLAVLSPPIILTQPQNQGVSLGADATFSILATGNPAVSYQWFSNTVPVPEATNATFTVTNVQAGQNGTVVFAVVSNALGTVTSANATLVLASRPVITTQPQGTTVARGGTAVFSVVATGSAPLSYQWSLNGTNLAVAGAATLTLTNVQPSQAGSYVVTVSNAGGSVVSSAAALTVIDLPTAGSLDNAFNVGTGGNAPVYAIAQQPDGLLVIGGAFDQFNGAALRRIARLKPDGSLDPAFNPGVGADGSVYAVALQANGQIVIGGGFFGVNGVSHRGIARLNADGSVDTSGNWASNGARTDGNVNAVVIQPDGKIIMGGAFGSVNGVPRNRLARLNADGTLDTAFVPGAGPNNAVLGLALRSDGEILVAGQFNAYNGARHNPVALLYPDGSLDTSFDIGPAMVGYAQSVSVQADGKILVAGGLSSVDGRNSKVLRLNADGSRDASFLAGNAFNSDALAVAAELSGKILIGGYFTAIGGVSRNGVARLNADGTLDASFDVGTGANNLVYAILSDSSRRVLIGGSFTQVNGVPRNRIARLYGDVQPVLFAAQPQSVTVAAGSPASFSVSLLSSGASVQPQFQWRFNGVDLPGATNSTLIIPAAFLANAGVYDVVVSNSIGSVTSSHATLAIARAVPAVMWPSPANITYGTALSAPQLNAASAVAGVFSYQPAASTVLNAGPSQALVAVFTPNDTDNYGPVTVTQRVTVLPVPLVIKAEDKAKYYGDPLPTFTATYSGFVNGDTAAALTTPASFATPAQAASSVGTYPITVSGAASGNYTITFQPGTLTVSKATPVVSWAAPTDITYGTALSGTQLGASTPVAGNFSYTPAVGTRLNAGSGQTLALVFTPSDPINYNPVALFRSLTVLRAPLTIVADSKSKLLGDALPPLTATYIGFVYGETASVLSTPATLTTTARANSPAGNYPILVSGATAANYSISFIPGSMSVGKLTPTVTWPAPADLTYGTALGTNQLNATTSVQGTFSYLPAAGTRLNAGATYPLVAAFTPNDPATYASVTVTQTVTVVKAPLTITADNQTNTFGSPLPALTASYSGFVYGENATVLNTSVSLATTAQANSPAGNYAITASGATAANYNITFASGVLVIAKATPQVSWAVPADIVYGTVLSSTQLNASASQLGAFSYSPAAGALMNAGPAQPLSALFTPADTANYNAVTVTRPITVQPATLSVVVDNKTKLFGEANPLLTAAYSGFVNNETEAVLTSLGAVTTPAQSTSPVGTYPITVVGAVASNYIFNITPGVLTINKATLVVTANDKTMTYGGIPPLLDGTVVGRQPGDGIIVRYGSYLVGAGNAVPPPVFDRAWGVAGNADQGFGVPQAIAVESSGTVLVLDRGFAQVLRFDGNGGFMGKWGAVGAGNGQFNSPYGVAVDAAGAVYVADTGSQRIQKMDASGRFLAKWGFLGNTGSGRFNSPFAVAADDFGNVFVLDRVTGLLQKFGNTGYFLTQWGGLGSGPGQFDNPRGVAVDAAGNVFVADTGNHRIQKFDNNGNYLGSWGGFGADVGQFNQPMGVAVDWFGNVFVADSANHRLQEFDGSGAFLTHWGGEGAGNGQFEFPSGVAVDALGQVFVADTGNYRIQKFRPGAIVPAGTFPIHPILSAPEDRLTNYNITFNPGTLTVQRAPLTITADSKTNIFGTPLPVLTATYTGLVNGETPAAISTPAMLTMAATNGSPVGVYPITVADATAINYAITFVDGALTIQPVNQAPSFAVRLTAITVSENAAPQSFANALTNISPGLAVEAGQLVSFYATNDNPALFSQPPAFSTNGTLTFTLAADQFGSATITVWARDDGGVANGGVDTSSPQIIVLTVLPVNHAPIVTLATNLLIVTPNAGSASYSGFAAFSPGIAREAAQSLLAYTVANNNAALFAVAPAIDLDGNLTFTPVANASGLALVTVIAQDDGGTANGGVDRSTNTFSIAVASPDNQPPTFVLNLTSLSVLEDVGTQTLANAVASISPGPSGEAWQTVSFLVTNDNPSLFSVAPAIAANGTLTYRPAPLTIGTATVTVYARDNGGTLNGGSDTSSAQTFTISVTPVNHPPTFTKGFNQTVYPGDGAVIVTNWATAISAGPPHESAQALTFVVTNDNNALFTAQPALDISGTLTFEPAIGSVGVATVTVQLLDDGGTADGGTNGSVAQTFTITLASSKVFLTTPAPVLVGDTLTVPVNLAASGVENAVGFTLAFDATKLLFTGATLGADAADASLVVNAPPASTGSVALLISKPANGLFAVGSNELALVNFAVLPQAVVGETALNFTDALTAREVSDTNAHQLPYILYVGTRATVTTNTVAYEGDVSPRPGGNGRLTVTDAVQVGRIAAGLDTITSFGEGGEFQRADSAPRETLGDGRITVSDWVQALRYAAGLDPLTPVGGPTGPVAVAQSHRLAALSPTGTRTLSVTSLPFVVGQTSAVSVVMAATGTENGVGLSLSYDPAALKFVSATLGSAGTGGTLLVNTNLTLSGRLGFVFALPAGSALATGAREIIRVNFATLAAVSPTTTIGLNIDTPVVREVTDVNANVVPTTFVSGTASILLPPTLKLLAPVRAAGGTLQLTFGNMDNSAPTTDQLAKLQLYYCTSVGLQNWVLLPGGLVISNSSFQIVDPGATGAGLRFYKVIQSP